MENLIPKLCRLCLSAPAIENSHVFPEWGFVPLYDEHHRMYHLSTDPAPRIDYEQKGIREALLCKGCETKFSRHENYAKQLFMVDERLGLPRPHSRTDNRVHYAPLKLFQLSLLWRADLAEHPLFHVVDIGPRHAERLRTMLLAEDPGSATDYPCVLGVLYLDGKARPDFIAPVLCQKMHGHRDYLMTFAGFHWLFVVSSHADKHPLTRYALQMDGLLPTFAFEATESQGFRGFAASVFEPNQANVDRLRAREQEKAERRARRSRA